MTGKLMLVPDTHVVVPNGFVSKVGAAYRTTNIVAKEILIDEAIDLLKTPPPDTPPVLRWEGDYLMLGSEKIAASTEDHQGFYWVTLMQNDIGGMCESIEEGRREAEKALGIMFEIEEV